MAASRRQQSVIWAEASMGPGLPYAEPVVLDQVAPGSENASQHCLALRE